MSKKSLAVLTALTLSLGTAGMSLANECVGTVTAVDGNQITIKCDDATAAKAAAIKVGDKATIKATEKAPEKAAGKAPAAPAPASKKKAIEGC